MALTITDVTSPTNCTHITVTINDEGTTRTYSASYAEIDSLFDNLSLLDQKKMLIASWVKYRRLLGRTVLNVSIA